MRGRAQGKELTTLAIAGLKYDLQINFKLKFTNYTFYFIKSCLTVQKIHGYYKFLDYLKVKFYVRVIMDRKCSLHEEWVLHDEMDIKPIEQLKANVCFALTSAAANCLTSSKYKPAWFPQTFH